MMTSACDRVFSTPELLEAILLQLTPLNNLLLAQRISKHFHTTIINTSSIQKALFFKPHTSTLAHKWTANPLLKEHFPPFFIINSHSVGWLDYSVLCMLDWAGEDSWAGQRKKKEAFLYEKASWRKMSTVSHPPGELKVRATSHGMGGDWVQRAVVRFLGEESQGESEAGKGGGIGKGDKKVERDGGGYLTMGPLYDLVESYLAACQGSYPRFKVEYFEGKSGQGPRMVLELGMTVQCCVDDTEEEEMVWLRSKGQEMETLSVLERCKVDEELRDFDMDGEPNDKVKRGLTWLKGGVGDYEWKEWVRERQPLRSLGSDVQG